MVPAANAIFLSNIKNLDTISFPLRIIEIMDDGDGKYVRARL